MDHLILLFCFLFISISPLANSQGKVSEPCIINDWRNSIGICKPFSACGSAISDLRSGVTPTLCPSQKTIVCCPTKPRLSEEMCEGYKEILRDHFGPTPLLPLDFLQDRPKEIQCTNYVNQLIVDGRQAHQDEFPFMVAIGWGSNSSNLEFRCGGTLIAEDFVLTAAHCVESKTGRPSYVLLGDIRLALEYGHGSIRRSVVKIVEFIKHPDYRRPLVYNDLALLRLERKVALSRSVLPACLPQPGLRLELTAKTIATGWGQIGTADQASNLLQAVNLTRFATKECNEYYSGNGPDKKLKYPKGILRSQFCAGDKSKGKRSKDTCKGDSGGPLVVTGQNHKCVYYIVGITSFGSSVCGIQPGVYTNVASYLDFIEKNVWPVSKK